MYSKLTRQFCHCRSPSLHTFDTIQQQNAHCTLINSGGVGLVSTEGVRNDVDDDDMV